MMAQVISTLCDVCLLHDGSEVPGQPYGLSVTVPGAKPLAFEIDVCETHGARYQELLAHLAEDARKAGSRQAPQVRQSKTAPAPAPVPGESLTCPGCGHVSATMGGLNSHCREVHARTLSELDGSATIPCPSGPGCDRMFSGWQGASSHLRTAHDYSTPAAREAVQAAREALAA